MVSELVGIDDEKKEQELRKEQEVIEKAIAFWNHPALFDVSPAEKRAFLHEQQGLTNAQIHKVWEEIVEKPEMDNIVNNSYFAGASSILDQNHHPYIHPKVSHRPKKTIDGQIFNSKGVPKAQSFANKNSYTYKNQIMSGREYPHLPTENDNNDIMERLDGSISFARGLSLLGVGGFLGISGAAAVRWLNGGRFEMLPPSSMYTRTVSSKVTNTSISRSAFQDQTHMHDHEGQGVGHRGDESEQVNIEHDSKAEFDEDEEYDEVERFQDNLEIDLEERLMERMDALLSSIDSNHVRQERLILKLANRSTVTDDSISLLKQSMISKNCNRNEDNQSNSSDTFGTNSLLLAELNEVKDSLGSMKNNILSNYGNEDVTEEIQQKALSDLSEKVDNCIEIIKSVVDSFVKNSDVANSKSQNTSESFVIENEELQDVQSLTTYPSTPAVGTVEKSQINHQAIIPTIPLTLKNCILNIVEKNDTMAVKNGAQLLFLYLSNLSGKPNNRRYRRIFTSNETYQQKVQNLKGGKELLLAVGFVEERQKSCFEWIPTGISEEEKSALILVEEAAAALNILKNADFVHPPDLLHAALSKLSSVSLSCRPSSVLDQSDHSETVNDRNDDHHRCHSQDSILKTPSGSSLLSPPIPKKIPFVPTPSDIT